MHQDFAQQAVGQMPQVPGPQPLDGTAIDELPKDGVDAVADPTQLSAPARVGISLGRPVRSEQIDAQVVAAFFAVLAPAQLDLYDRVLSQHHATLARRQQAHTQQVERLHYEASLVERQFRRVDPDNRLVAAELEQRWEQALRALKAAQELAQLHQLQQEHESVPLDPALRAALVDLGQRLPTIWETGVLNRA